ncbi:MAG: transposase [Verrucomicrobiota bacterium]
MKTKEKRPLSPVEKAGLPTAAYPGGFRRAVRGQEGEEGEEPQGRKGTGRKRILGPKEGSNAYHVMSRTVGGEMLFGDTEKEGFVRIMRRLERFAGVEILTYAVMGNHFHLLVRVPQRDKFLKRFDGRNGEEKLLEHLKLLYSKSYLGALRAELSDLRSRGMHGPAEDLLERFKERLCDLPHFVKELKERFSRWFNKHHGRKGTLWMDRYKSVLVEDGDAMRTMAAYIDLNPIRAGLVKDPKDYRWCGYAESVAGSKRARRGLCRAVDRPLDSWNDKAVKGSRKSLTAAQWYRCWLFGEGKEVEKNVWKSGRKGISRRKVKRVLEAGGQLSRSELLRCRVRYFSDGVAIGSRSFVEGVFQERRDHFGAKRKDGARALREAAGLGVFSLRALRVQAVE